MVRPDAVVEEPLFLDEPEDYTPPARVTSSPMDELFADENEPAPPSLHAECQRLPQAWIPGRGAVSGRDQHLRSPLLISLIALGIAIGFAIVTFLR